jgi:sugar/nucleoside kinase (ribokinase family)
MTDEMKEGGGMFDIAMVGHFSKDRIIVGDDEKTVPGGAVYYGSIPLARLGFRVAVLTKAADSDADMLRPMEEAGAVVFTAKSGVTTSIENRYLDETLERRVCAPLAFAGAYEESDLPDIEAEIWHIGGLIRGETSIELLNRISTLGSLSVDAQGFVRVIRGGELAYEDWAEKHEALPLIDFLKVDAAEAEVLTGVSEPADAAWVLEDWGAREVLLTHPGGLLVTANGKQFNVPFSSHGMKGRTGRGDTTISAYLAWRLDHETEASAKFAAALVSLKMQAEGPFLGTMEAVLKKMKEF